MRKGRICSGRKKKRKKRITITVMFTFTSLEYELFMSITSVIKPNTSRIPSVFPCVVITVAIVLSYYRTYHDTINSTRVSLFSEREEQKRDTKSPDFLTRKMQQRYFRYEYFVRSRDTLCPIRADNLLSANRKNHFQASQLRY